MGAPKRTGSERAAPRSAATVALPAGAGGSYAAQVGRDSTRSRAFRQRGAPGSASNTNSPAVADIRTTQRESPQRPIGAPPPALEIHEVSQEEQDIENELRRLSARARTQEPDSVNPGRHPNTPGVPPQQQHHQTQAPVRKDSARAPEHGEVAHRGAASRNSSGRPSAGRGRRPGAESDAAAAARGVSSTATAPLSTGRSGVRSVEAVSTRAKTPGKSLRKSSGSASGWLPQSTSNPDLSAAKRNSATGTGATKRTGSKSKPRGALAGKGSAAMQLSNGGSKVPVGTTVPSPPPVKAEASTGSSSTAATQRTGKQKPITAVW